MSCMDVNYFVLLESNTKENKKRPRLDKLVNFFKKRIYFLVILKLDKNQIKEC